MTKTFEMNGKAYATDADTLSLLRQIVSDGVDLIRPSY